MSAILAKLAVTNVSRAAVRHAACYSTEVPAGAKFDVSSFIGRIDALHAAQAKKGQEKRSNIKFKVKPSSSSSSDTPIASAARRQAGGAKPQSPRAPGTKNATTNPEGKRFNGPRKPYNGKNNYASSSSTPARPTKNLKRLSNMEVDSALTDSSNEKVDLHVAPSGGILFDNNTRRTAPNRGQRTYGQRPGGQQRASGPPGQRFGGNNRNASPRFGAKKGSPRAQRKGADSQKRRVVVTKLSPEQALRAVHRRLATKGSTINIGAVNSNTISPYTSGLSYSAGSRILRAIRQVPQSGKYTQAELQFIVESTCKGSLAGSQIPVSTKAHGQESIIPVLNGNTSYSPELKNLFLKLASGETPISSLKK